MNSSLSANDEELIISRTEDLARTPTNQTISLSIENTNSDTQKAACDSDKAARNSDKAARESNLASRESDKAPHKSTKAPRESDLAPRESNQALQESTKAPCESNQAPCESNQAPCESNQAPCESNQAPCESNQAPCESNQAPRDSNQAPSSAISTNINQNCLDQEKSESDAKTEFDPKNISKITVFEKDNFNKTREDNSSQNQNESNFSIRDHQKQENSKEITKLPSGLMTDKKQLNYSKKQISTCISEEIPDGKYSSSPQKRALRIPVQKTETYEIKNASEIEEFGQVQIDPNSSVSQVLPENIKPRKKIPEISALYDLTSHPQEPQEKTELSTETSVKNLQELNLHEPSKEVLNHLQTKTFPIKIFPVETNNAKPNDANSPENRINFFEHDNVNQKCPDVNVTEMIFAKNGQIKPLLQTPLPPTSINHGTALKQVRVREQGSDSCQSIPEPNRTFDLNNERINIIVDSRTKSQFHNSGPISFRNKFGRDNRTNSLSNLSKTNQAEINTYQNPLNQIDTRSIVPKNNLNTQNLTQPIAANRYPQINQSGLVRLSMPASMARETSESNNLSSFPKVEEVHSEFSNYQFSQSNGPDSSSVKSSHYSNNAPLRQTNVCNRPTNVSNTPFSIHPSGVYSIQSFQQNLNRPGSSGLLRWSHNTDQKMGQGKYYLLQTYGNPGISSSYQNPSNSFRQNLAKDSHLYSNPVAIKGTLSQKMTHPDQNLGRLSSQCNPEKRSNPNSEGINKEHNLMQNFSVCYNPVRQSVVNPSKSDLAPNRSDDYSFPSTRNSFPRKSLFENVHNETEPQRKLPSPLPQTDPQFCSQNQNILSHFQRSTQNQSQAFSYFDASFPMTKSSPLRETAHSPFPMVSNIPSFNSQAGYSRSLSSFLNNTPYKLRSKGADQSINMTTATTTTKATSTLLSTKESQRKRNLTTFDKGEDAESQKAQNKIHQSDFVYQNVSLNRHQPQANAAECSQSNKRFSSSESHPFQSVHTKDILPLSIDATQTVYNSSNSANIMTWSQNSQKGFAVYDPIHSDLNPKAVNLDQQSNHQIMTGQSFDDYSQRDKHSFEKLLENPRALTSSNYNSTENGSVLNVDRQQLYTPQMEDQTKSMTEEFPVRSQMTTRIAEGPVICKVESQDTQIEFSSQIEASSIKSPIRGQFENNHVKRENEDHSSRLVVPPSSTTTVNAALKAVDFFGQSNPGMANEESFLFSDLDPLFTSSLLTNDLTYFPESNLIFDQYFQNNASVAMPMEYSHEDQTQANMKSLDPSQTPVSQQPHQLTPLLDISNNNSRASPASIFSLTQNQFFIPTTSTGINQVNNGFGLGTENNMVPFNHCQGQFAGGDISELNQTPFSSQQGIIESDIAYSEDVYSNSSATMKYSASPWIEPPGSYGTVNGVFGKNADSYEDAETKVGAPKKHRLKRERSDEADKYTKKKLAVPKGIPRPRGRPPKNRTPMVPSFDTTVTNFTRNPITVSTHTAKSLNIATEASKNNNVKTLDHFSQTQPPKPQIYDVNLENSPLPFSNCGNQFVKSMPQEYTTEIYRPETQTCPPEPFLVPDAPPAKINESSEAQQELNEQEVINVVTKCLETISRSEEEKSSDQMNDFPLNSIDKDSSLNSSITCTSVSRPVSDVASQENEALSKEEMLMRAYVELKKKLEERMSKSLWRQSFLKRNKPKISDRFRRLSKKECMTAYSGTTSWELDDLFPRYCNRPPGSTESEKLVATADSTSIDSNSEEKENSINLPIGPVKTALNRQELFPVANEQLISSTELSEPKDPLPRPGKNLLLPSMIDVVRTRLSGDLLYSDRISQNSPFSEELKEIPEHSNLLENKSRDCSETVVASQNIDREVLPNESKQLDLQEKREPNNPYLDNSPPITNLTSSLEPEPLPSLTLSPPPPPPPPAPMQVLYFTVKKEKLAPNKVEPNIVENAKTCFESIGSCLTKAESDFDSFLISYANVVQGLLNCGADQYSRIKAIVLNGPDRELNKSIIENSKNFDKPISEETDAKRSQDLDASEIQDDPSREKSTINIDDFNCNYANIVQAILRSRVDEYRNIKQALGRNICSTTDVHQDSKKTLEKCERDQRDSTDMLDPREQQKSEETLNESKPELKAQIDIPQSQIPTRKTSRRSRNEAQLNRNRNQPNWNKGVPETANYQKLSCKKKVKLRSNYLTSKEESSSSERAKSPGFRIILSSSYFIDRNDKNPNLKIKRKKSKFLGDEDNLANKDTKLTFSSDENFVEESTGDHVIGLDSESESDERSMPIAYKNPLNTSANQELNRTNNIGSTNTSYVSQSNNYSLKRYHLPELKSERGFSSESVLDGDNPKLSIKNPGFKEMVPIANSMGSGDNKKRKVRRAATLAGFSAMKCPCGCCNEEIITRADPKANQPKDPTKSFKIRNRSKIIKPKSASIVRNFERSWKFDNPSGKLIPKHWNDPGPQKDKVGEDKSEENRKCIKVCSNSAGHLEPIASQKLKDGETQMSSKIVSVKNGTRENLLIKRNPLNPLDSVSECEEISESEREVVVDLHDSDVNWTPKKSHKKKKKKTKSDMIKYSSFPNKNDSKTDLFNSKTEIRNYKKAEERSTKSINGAAIKEFDWNDNNTNLKISFRNILPTLKSSSSFSVMQARKKDPHSQTVNSLDSTKAVNKTSKAIFGDNADDSIWPNEKGVVFSLGDSDVDIPVGFGGQRSQCEPSVALKESDLKTKTMASLGNFGEISGKKETKGCEERQKFLVKKRGEIGASRKRPDIKSAMMSKNCSKYLSSNTIETSSVASKTEINNDEDRREESGIFEAIDEGRSCLIRADGFESDNSDISCNSLRSLGSKDNQNRRLVDKNRTPTLKVKLPISLNQKREKSKHAIKLKSLNSENKLIIRKNCLKENKKVVPDLFENKTEREGSFLEGSTSKEIRSVDSFSSSDKDEDLLLPSSDSFTPRRARSLKGKSSSISTLKKTKEFSTSSQRERLLNLQENIKSNLFDLENRLKDKKFDLTEATSDDLQNLEYWHENVLATTVSLTEGSLNKTKKLRQKIQKEQNSLCSLNPEDGARLDLPKTKKTETTKTKNVPRSITDKKGTTKKRLIVSGTLRRYRTSSLKEPLSNKSSKNERMPTKSNDTRQKPKKVRRSGTECLNYQCTYCSKSFKKPSQLLYHTRWHTGVRPFVCSQCNKGFVSKSHLSRHQQTHSTERKYMCPTCKHGFTKAYNLAVHQLTHSGIETHTCVDCSKEFRIKAYLNRHRRKYHKETYKPTKQS